MPNHKFIPVGVYLIRIASCMNSLVVGCFGGRCHIARTSLDRRKYAEANIYFQWTTKKSN